MIALIDYDAGNIKSVEKALHYLGEETTVTRDPQTLLNADSKMVPLLFILTYFCFANTHVKYSFAASASV